MPKKYRRWPPEKIEAMRQELAGGATLQQVGDREGVSRERIRQLVGNVGGSGRHQRVLHNQEAVKQLAMAGRADEEIAVELSLSLGYARILRLRAGVRRPHPRKKWSCELILQKALEWHESYGYTPAAVDWNPSMAIAMGHTERVKRFREFGAPHAGTVQQYFGSWSEMIRATNLPPAPTGYPGRLHWRIASKGTPS